MLSLSSQRHRLLSHSLTLLIAAVLMAGTIFGFLAVSFVRHQWTLQRKIASVGGQSLFENVLPPIFHDRLPATLANLLCVVTVLRIPSWTTVHDDDLAFLAETDTLECAILGSPLLGDGVVGHVGRNAALVDLQLRGTAVSDRSMSGICAFRRLKFLALNDTRISETGTAYLVCAESLVQLRLDGTNMGDPAGEHLAQLESLEFLSLANTRFGNAGLLHLNGHRRLRELHLDHTAITDDGLRRLHSLPNLKALSLKDTRITDAGILELARNLNLLEALDLTGTDISLDGFRELSRAHPHLWFGQFSDFPHLVTEQQ